MEDLPINIEEALAVAIEAARKAGRIIWDSVQQRRSATAAKCVPAEGQEEAGDGAGHHANFPGLQVEEKSGSTDLVTQYDKQCDATITAMLQQYTSRAERETPGVKFSFITEEHSPDAALGEGLTWIVDPIDGTTSFVHGLPDCCVSIGLTWRRKAILAVVFCPFTASGVGPSRAMEVALAHGAASSAPGAGKEADGAQGTNASPAGIPTPPPVAAAATAANAAQKDRFPRCEGELFTAILGRGCFANGIRTTVNAAATPENALLVFNYPGKVALTSEEAARPDHAAVRHAKLMEAIDAAARIRERICAHPVPGVRMYGSTVTILAQVAAGRVDAFIEPAGMAWDVCAGALLVTEAGGTVRNLHGEPFDLAKDTTIAASATEKLTEFCSSLCAEENYGRFWIVK